MVATVPSLVRPGDVALPLEARARAYLHANCAHCHQPGGTGRGSLDLRASVASSAMNVCNVAPIAGGMGLATARLVVPGQPGLSVLSRRMHAPAASPDRMPALGAAIPDPTGLAVVDGWIASLAACP